MNAYTHPELHANDIVQRAAMHMHNRASTYDKPGGERSMAKTVAMFNTLADADLTEEDGWMFMAILKVVRSQQGDFRLDNYEDGCAYFALAAEAGAVARNYKHSELPDA
ncbi:DUF6378 domain-containing protein [Vreelandella massiliensis]|uniref:DUF6378 domain-containing protein n=1 Tax=Vreelandella massiliensis TaxID=1816686 RepID=UPI00096A404A|nr:DUF6378 domain-containing protein [Halomonas massiliensis]